MTFALWIYLALMLGVIIGWFFCALFTSSEIRKLRDLADGRRDAWLRAIKAKESNSWH